MFARPLILDADPEGLAPLAGCARRLARRAATRTQRPCATSCTSSSLGPSKDEMPIMVPLCTLLIPATCAAKRSPVPTGRSTAPRRPARYKTVAPSGVDVVISAQVPRPSKSPAGRGPPRPIVGLTHLPGEISTTNGNSRSHRAARNGLLEPNDVPATTTGFCPTWEAPFSSSRTMSTRAWRLDRHSSASYVLLPMTQL